MTDAPPRVLVIDDRVPEQSYGAGFGRMIETCRELAAAGCAVTLAPMVAGDPTPELVALGVTVAVGDPESYLSGPDEHDVVVVSRPHNWRLARAVRAHQPHARLLYDGEALFFARLEQQAARSSGEEAARLRAASRHYREIEDRIAGEADAIVAVSQEEAEWFRAHEDACPVRVVLAVAADVVPSPAGFWSRRDALFVAGWGSGAESPNGDGLRWLAGEVVPRLAALRPWARIRVTGGEPPAELGDLAGPNLGFVGRVDDLADAYDAARVAVAPVPYGSGIKVKVVEALQYGVPVVTTTAGAHGLPASFRDLVDVADDAGEFARSVWRYLEEPETWRRRRAQVVPLPDAGPGYTSLLEVVRELVADEPPRERR